jgi:hypothetical protein
MSETSAIRLRARIVVLTLAIVAVLAAVSYLWLHQDCCLPASPSAGNPLTTSREGPVYLVHLPFVPPPPAEALDAMKLVPEHLREKLMGTSFEVRRLGPGDYLLAHLFEVRDPDTRERIKWIRSSRKFRIRFDLSYPFQASPRVTCICGDTLWKQAWAPARTPAFGDSAEGWNVPPFSFRPRGGKTLEMFLGPDAAWGAMISYSGTPQLTSFIELFPIRATGAVARAETVSDSHPNYQMMQAVWSVDSSFWVPVDARRDFIVLLPNPGVAR